MLWLCKVVIITVAELRPVSQQRQKKTEALGLSNCLAFRSVHSSVLVLILTLTEALKHQSTKRSNLQCCPSVPSASQQQFRHSLSQNRNGLSLLQIFKGWLML